MWLAIYALQNWNQAMGAFLETQPSNAIDQRFYLSTSIHAICGSLFLLRRAFCCSFDIHRSVELNKVRSPLDHAPRPVTPI